MARTPIEVSWYDTDISFVTVRGAPDQASADRLAADLTMLIRAGEQVVVDLSHADFVDHGTAGVLKDADRLAAARGSTFTILTNDDPAAWTSLSMADVLDPIVCVSSRDDAIRAARTHRRGTASMFRELRCARRRSADPPGSDPGDRGFTRAFQA